MNTQDDAKKPSFVIPPAIIREAFIASKMYVGEPCASSNCEEPIKPKDKIRYYGGPFIFHEECLRDIIEKA